MKKAIISMVVALVAVAGVFAQSIVITTGDWAPFTGKDLPGQGIATEIVAAVCKAGGIDAKFEFYPWPRTESMVADGISFGAFPYAYSDERASKYDFSEPLFYSASKFIYYGKTKNLESLKIATLADLAKYSVVIVAGTWIEKDLKSAGIKYNNAPSLESAVKMLQAGRVDILIEEQTAAYSAIAKFFPSEIDAFKTIQETFFGAAGPNYLMVSRTYPKAKELLVKFNAGLKTIKSNGTYDALAKKYKFMTTK